MTMSSGKKDGPRLPPSPPQLPLPPPPEGKKKDAFLSFSLLGPSFEVSGFRAEPAVEVVAALPEEVFVPAGMLSVIAWAKRLDVWVDTGRRVRAWAEELGAGEASWIDPDGELIRVPPELAGGDVPPFVRGWVADIPEIESIIGTFITIG